ncbi:hypothetical protein ET445_00515 [Agromyces protaetiae]|uniref:Nucleotidyl transferase AbiEii/AbiGii toxin family protein n=1 Tax=Agromyces protaetiae TaxID=2509455 RepID=A0A4P6F8Z0_9MICO|nr:hypothetical protein [Agromyces protaetiae]QAY72035.1 hypothetical protein ET445_00515 [Agromyces protaetiae]
MRRFDDATLFDRDRLIEALRLLIAELRESGERGGIRIIGGAALSLRYFDRGVTVDIDAHFIGTHETIERASARVADAQQWTPDWLNNAAVGFIPEYGATRIAWQTIFNDGDIIIEVAPADALLAMKLRANRPGRGLLRR